MNKTTLNSQKEKHSTLSLRRATPEASSASPRGSISIHALLAESDTTLSHNYNTTIISIHALLAESDRVGECFVIAAGVFLSTLSLRRATCSSRWRNSTGRYFYPRSPCGERRDAVQLAGTADHFYPRSPCGERQLHFLTVVRVFLISIHALLAESDLSVMYHNNLALSFLSTLSLRRATGSLAEVAKYATISIHALLAESDVDNKADHNPANQHFYPRSPCGERR